MAPRREYRVHPLGQGRFRLVTTVTHVTESIVTEDHLQELGLEPPANDVPWHDGHAKESRVWNRDGQADPDLEAAREHWNRCVGGHDPRLRSQMPQWVREFGLATVREAIDIVAAGMPRGSTGAKYLMLVRVFREMRQRAGGAE